MIRQIQLGLLAALSLFLLTSISHAGIYNLRPDKIKSDSFKPVLAPPCWNGIVDSIWPQIFAYYVGQNGSFEVERNVVKQGSTMLLSFDPSVLNHPTFGQLEKITVEYKNRRNCKDTFGGFSNFTR